MAQKRKQAPAPQAGEALWRVLLVGAVGGFVTSLAVAGVQMWQESRSWQRSRHMEALQVALEQTRKAAALADEAWALENHARFGEAAEDEKRARTPATKMHEPQRLLSLRIREFWVSAGADALNARQREVENQLQTVLMEYAASTGSLDAAKAYADWLEARAAGLEHRARLRWPELGEPQNTSEQVARAEEDAGAAFLQAVGRMHRTAAFLVAKETRTLPL